MSAWDEYITNMQKSGLHMSGIFGVEGGAWAVSPKMKATQQEVFAIAQAIKKQDFSPCFTLGGKKTTMIKCSPDSFTGKIRNADCDEEKYLMHVSMAQTCVVVGGICGPNERDSTALTDAIRDYLLKEGY